MAIRRSQYPLPLATARDEERFEIFQSTLQERNIQLFIKSVKGTINEDMFRNYRKSMIKCTDSEVEVKPLKDKARCNSNWFLGGTKSQLK